MVSRQSGRVRGRTFRADTRVLRSEGQGVSDIESLGRQPAACRRAGPGFSLPKGAGVRWTNSRPAEQEFQASTIRPPIAPTSPDRHLPSPIDDDS